jgi:hypothetical protein
MKNWNTDVSKFNNPEDRKIWELIQKIEYGLDGQPLSKKEVLQYWDAIKTKIAPENKRLLEFFLWGKQYSLPTNNYFWTK